MTTSFFERYSAIVTGRSKTVIAAGMAVTVLVGAGLGRDDVPAADIGEAQIQTPAHEARTRIEQTYDASEPVESFVIVRARDETGTGAALTQAAILEGLRFQQAVRALPDVAGTLRPTRAILGFENLVGSALCLLEEGAAGDPGDTPWRENGRVAQGDCPLAVQIARLKALPEAHYQRLLEAILSPESSPTGANLGLYLPVQIDEGNDDRFRARATIVSQGSADGSPPDDDAIRAAQLALQAELPRWFDDAFIYGEGIFKAESARAVGDSFRIIAPVACLLLILLLVGTLRSGLDIALCAFGLVLVLVWLQGIQAWLQVPSTSILIALPFLLVGLAIDYMLHVTMRYREQLEGSPAVPGSEQVGRAMAHSLHRVLPALALAAFSTAVGFLANYLSPLSSIRDFALVSGLGILATFLIFSAIIPAIKAEVEKGLARRGKARARPALGRGRNRSQRWLVFLAGAAVRRPKPIALAAAVLGIAGLIAATGLETSFDRTDFVPTPPPPWMKVLPAPFAPGHYSVSQNIDYLVDNFRLLSRLLDAEILVDGDITSAAFLTAIEQVARRRATESGTLITDSPASLIRLAAFHDRDFAQSVMARDDNGDGLPDRDIAAIYDALFELAPERAARVLHRVEGEYRSARLEMALLLNARSQAIAFDVREVARHLSENAAVSAVATGDPVIAANVQAALFDTLLIGFSVTLCVIGAVLTGLYGWLRGAYAMGPILLAPVVAALAALLGAMRLLDIPFNSETVVITSLAIGIGVDYSVHIGERFLAARADLSRSLSDCMESVLTGTGGALLGSTATTVCGFGVLALAISPPLQRFGLVTALAILFGFIASMVLLPALLVLRDRRSPRSVA